MNTRSWPRIAPVLLGALIVASVLGYYMFGGIKLNPDSIDAILAGRRMFEGHGPETKRLPLLSLATMPLTGAGLAAQIAFTQALSLAAYVIAVVLSFLIGERLELKFSYLLPILVGSYWPFCNTIAQGTVDGLHIALLFGTIYACLLGRFSLAYVISALACLARPESLLLPACITVWQYVESKKLKPSLLISPVLAVLPALVWMALTSHAKHGYMDEVAHRGMAGPLVFVKLGAALGASLVSLGELRQANEGSKIALAFFLPGLAVILYTLFQGTREAIRVNKPLVITLAILLCGWLVIHTIFPFEFAAHRYGMIVFMLVAPLVCWGVQEMEWKLPILVALSVILLLPLVKGGPGLACLGLVGLGAVGWAVTRRALAPAAVLCVPVSVLGLSVAIPKVEYANIQPLIEQIRHDLTRQHRSEVVVSLTSESFAEPSDGAVLESSSSISGDHIYDASGKEVRAMLLTQEDIEYARTGKTRASTDLRFALYSRKSLYTHANEYDAAKAVLRSSAWSVADKYKFSEHQTPLFLYIRS